MISSIFLADTLFTDSTGEHHLKVEALLDDNGEYTGRHRGIVDDGFSTHITLDQHAIWIEENKGQTMISKLAGDLIENYYD